MGPLITAPLAFTSNTGSPTPSRRVTCPSAEVPVGAASAPGITIRMTPVAACDGPATPSTPTTSAMTTSVPRRRRTLFAAPTRTVRSAALRRAQHPTWQRAGVLAVVEHVLARDHHVL